MDKESKMERIRFGFLLIIVVLLTGCVDNTTAVQHCDKLGLQSTGKIFGCSIECVNVTTGQLYDYEGDCKLVRN